MTISLCVSQIHMTPSIRCGVTTVIPKLTLLPNVLYLFTLFPIFMLNSCRTQLEPLLVPSDESS